MAGQRPFPAAALLAALTLLATACASATPTAAPQITAVATRVQATPLSATPVSATPVPATPVPAATPAPLNMALGRPGMYFVTPFKDSDECPLAPTTTATRPPCDPTVDDSIRFTFTIPDGWSVIPCCPAIWLPREHADAPNGAGMVFGRGGWLHGDPCLTDAAPIQDIPVGPTAEDFASALAAHPLLDVTAPVDITLAGYHGKYVDLQIPADISKCPTSYWPWEPGIYAQGPGSRWHLWILDVNDIRVVAQTQDYEGTLPQRKAELKAMVDSIQITP